MYRKSCPTVADYQALLAIPAFPIDLRIVTLDGKGYELACVELLEIGIRRSSPRIYVNHPRDRSDGLPPEYSFPIELIRFIRSSLHSSEDAPAIHRDPEQFLAHRFPPRQGEAQTHEYAAVKTGYAAINLLQEPSPLPLPSLSRYVESVAKSLCPTEPWLLSNWRAGQPWPRLTHLPTVNSNFFFKWCIYEACGWNALTVCKYFGYSTADSILYESKEEILIFLGSIGPLRWVFFRVLEEAVRRDHLHIYGALYESVLTAAELVRINEP